MRVISVSVDGVHQAAQRGLFQWLASQNAEIICLQDLRASLPELEDAPEFQLDGYSGYFLDSSDPHSNGVGIYTREIPKAIMYGFGFASGEDMNGRYIQADFDHISIGSLLVPAVNEKTEASQKARFLTDLQNHLGKITHKRRRYIICGNWNMAHATDDVQNAGNYLEQSGFTEDERRWLQQTFSEIGYRDGFRQSNKDADEYSWWPSGKIGQGDGWRTDYQVVSKELATQVEYAVIYTAGEFSSHAPVIVDYDLGNL